MRRRKIIKTHNSQLWARLYQLVKVEEPITFDRIRRLCHDVDLCDLDSTLHEMCAARRINVARDWSGSRMIEIYRYGDGSIINVFDRDEARTPRHQPQHQLALAA